jgi:hypothetical protein
MATRIKLRRDTEANWTSVNPILAAGEPGLETDTGKIKYGDGTSRWNSLEYGVGDDLASDGAITVQTGDADRWLVRLRREDSSNPVATKGVTVYSTNYDSLGNAIVVARLNLNDDGVAVAKFTPAGHLVWKKSIDAVDNGFYPESNAVIDSADNILLVVNPDSGTTKIIVKLNGDTGAVVFSEELNLASNFEIRAMAVDSGNNIIIGGDFYFTSAATTTAFVAKLNPTATDITWQKSLTVDSGASSIYSVAVDFNDDIVAVGKAEVERTVNGATATNDEMLVAKITALGGSGWQKSVRLENDTPFGEAWNLSLDSIGNIYVAGTYYVDNPGDNFVSSGKSNAVVLFKMTTLGAMAWDRRVGPGACDWVGVSTAVGDDGDLYLYASTYELNPLSEVEGSDAGYYTNRLALARYNKTTGAVIWQSYFDNPLAQEVPGYGNDGPFGGVATDLMAVQDGKILIGGAVRLGQSDADLDAPWSYEKYFNQGFLAQFDTDATKFIADGWTLSTSRIPGRLTNTLVAVNGPVSLQNDIAMTEGGTASIATQAVSVSVRRTASRVNTWTFGKDGTFTAPADADIRLQQRQLGYATMYGRFPNTSSDIWFESVCHDAEGFAYAVGSNWFDGDRAYIYKFTPEGAVVWQRELFSGSGAEFTVTVTTGTYATPIVTYGGNNYKVGDRILIDGEDLGGDASNTLVLEVATITNANDYVGEVATVTIDSGTGAVGHSNTYTSVQDYNDDAECEIRSMTYNPVSGNLEVIIITSTELGDSDMFNLDGNWSETVIVTMDSGSGAVVSTTTLKDEGDVYAIDTDVSVTGKIAVVGEKFNEYTEYGTITPLAGSAVDKLWVTKADIDAEHFPGEDIPGGSSISDWWITGTGITDQIRVQTVNQYTGSTGTVKQGSGAVFTIDKTGTSTSTTYTSTSFGVGLSVVGEPGVATITATKADWNIGTDYDTFEALSTGTVFTVITGGGPQTFTTNNKTTNTGVDVIWTGVWASGTEGLNEVPQSITYEVISTGSYSVTAITNSGTDYLVGHKIKVLGSALGGVDGTNDCIITVDASTSGAISSVSNSGTSTGTSTQYTLVTGTNYLTGIGAVFNINFDPTTGTVSSTQVATVGEDYVTGDVITILGTSFAGGTAPANNITVTVTNADGAGGAIIDIDTSTGTHASTHLQLTTDASVDYAATGTTFAIKQNMDGEAFVWTPDFTKAIGGITDDAFTGVVWNAAGTHLYAVGQGTYEVNYDQALVVKFSSTGTLVASKFLNNNLGNNSANRGAVALMANDSIVVVHDQYNQDHDETDEVLVTKLDSSLNIIWQQFIGYKNGNGQWRSPESNISVAVDPATDEIVIACEHDDGSDLVNDQAIAIVKLDTDGEVIWKRLFGVHESDTQMCYQGYGNKALSIHGDQFTLVGFTDAPNDDNDNNAFIVTLPLDGTGVGLHGLWTYAELDDERIQVWRLSGRTSTAFTATEHTGGITSVDNVKYYYTDYPDYDFTFYPQVIRSNQGGAVEFADGSRQTFSTAIVPQVRISAGRYMLRPEDSGRHILIEDSNYDVIIPNWERVTLPVGYTVTLVNISNNDAYVECENDGLRGEMWLSGGDTKTQWIRFPDNGSGQMITLIKIREGTRSDDSENDGDVWMVAGADIYDND